MKRILGLDLGSNSIGWALIESDFPNKKGQILGLGSRIIPMSQDIIGDFEKGNTVSQTAERTRMRGVRRLRERFLLRRQRLFRVLHIAGFLPSHFASEIDFIDKKGQFLNDSEPKLAYDNGDFIFKDEFNAMLEEFKREHPGLLEDGKKIPFDWTIYYLRKEALNREISKEALAWVILQFNQKRGYYQLRGEEEEEDKSRKVEYYELEVVNIAADDEPNRKGEVWYNVHLENGWIYKRKSTIKLDDWIGKKKEFIITTNLAPDGTEKVDKEGNVSRSFRMPKEDDWGLVKQKTENDLDKSNIFLGEYIYSKILHNPMTKIIGGHISTIERKYYKDELSAILNKQKEFHPELTSDDILQQCIEDLYSKNTNHKEMLTKKGLNHLIIEDILFYQRPLRSQKSTIADCPFEFRTYIQNGERKEKAIKVCSKSHPLYQEFRVLQWINNLRIYKKHNEESITADLLGTIDNKESLFEYLMTQKSISQKELLKHLGTNERKARWNYVEDKSYPMAETMYEINKRLKNIDDIDIGAFDQSFYLDLWHIIYSVTDKLEYSKALATFANKHNLPTEPFCEAFRKFPPFKSDYGRYSLKAIKKFLSLMRFGSYWQEDQIDNNTKTRINRFIDAEFDESIDNSIREKLINFQEVEDFQGLSVWLASYVIYNRHSEMSEFNKWHTSKDLDTFINNFKQHSLRNPIVEQVIVECLRVVRDIWDHYGDGEPDYFDEIHVELARELKNNSDRRQKISENIRRNEITNQRIKYLIAELAQDSSIANVRPFSPGQQLKLRIYEEGVLNSNEENIPDDINKMLKTAQPSSSQLKRYKLWLEQGYRSPYTGAVIPLSGLFTSDYEIEHIIPQSKYFDDSFNNKIICESDVNKLKDNQLGLEFIKNHGGEIVETGMGKKVRVFNQEEYETFVLSYYSNNRIKKLNLLLDDIPQKMVERQKNDTRYISKYMMNALSSLVRSKDEDKGYNSKNVIATNGSITNRLKNDWGLNDVWNDLILPRFERLNELTNSDNFTVYNKRHQKLLPTVPLELAKGFSKKRIDHRHHAMDALVVAATTRSHVNYLNNQHALGKQKKEKFELMHKLRNVVEYTNSTTGAKRKVGKEFLKPWSTFTTDAANNLRDIIISFKQNLRVINKATNYTEQWVKQNGKLRKKMIKQTKGDNWAIRKPMHKDTVSGLVKMRMKKAVSLNNAIDEVDNIVDRELKTYIKKLFNKSYDKKAINKHFRDKDYMWNDQNVKKIEIWYWAVDADGEPLYTASRTKIDESFNEKKIQNVTDSGIRTILLNHLEQYKGRTDEAGKSVSPEKLAFSPEGIADMNSNIKQLNNGKHHHPIHKVRIMETKGNKFPVGYESQKDKKFVEAAKGTNLYFGIYQDESGKRFYETIPLNIAIERQKQGFSPVPEFNDKMIPLLLYLSPNDLVVLYEKDGKENIYKMVSSTGVSCFFIQHHIAIPVVNKLEFSALNKMERSITGEMIKDKCWKIKVNRVGQVSR